MPAEIELLTFVSALLAAVASVSWGYMALKERRRTQFQLEELRWTIRSILDREGQGQDSWSMRKLPRARSAEFGHLIKLQHDLKLQQAENRYFRELISDQEMRSKGSRDPESVLAKRQTENDVQKDLARDINHALKTPLSRLDTAAAFLEAEVLEPIEAAQRIKNATQVCYYYLDSFRSLSIDYSPGADSDHLDFKASLYKAARLYASDSGKDIGIQIDVPERVTAVSDYYAIATLLPLVENAVEASPNLADIKIEGSENKGELNIAIENLFEQKPPLDFEKRGISNKPNKSNEGLGIAIVRAFLSPLATGELNFKSSDEEKTLVASVRMKAK